MENNMDLINNFDVDKLHEIVINSKPFPYFVVDDFLDEKFVNEIYMSLPSYQEASKVGRTFEAINEINKVQVTEDKYFPEPINRLNELLQSKEFLDKLSRIIDIPDLIPDPNLVGGGIHETSGGGRLDVHVDFNYNKELKLFRRVNILIYFNKGWKEEYGGILDLWDTEVKKCYAKVLPKFNRMVCFATSEISYHGVTPVTCPEGMSRKSFAGYYYTCNPPANWNGEYHTTIFKQRPSDWGRSIVTIPLFNAKNSIARIYNRAISYISKHISD